MHCRNHWVAAGLVVVSLGLAGCGVITAAYDKAVALGVPVIGKFSTARSVCTP